VLSTVAMVMPMPTDVSSLSPSEKRTLQQIAEGEFHVREMDWVALQRLKRNGLAAEKGQAVVITQDGWRALHGVMPNG
jgi:hypothetical protein